MSLRQIFIDKNPYKKSSVENKKVENQQITWQKKVQN